MNANVRRLKAVIELEPGSLVRVLHFFQARNVTPTRVTAERLGPELLSIEVDVAAGDLTAEAMRAVTAKVAQLPVSICAVVCE